MGKGAEDRRKAYEEELYRQTHPYEMWIAEHERREASYPVLEECTLLEREAYFPEKGSKRQELLEVIAERKREDSFVLLFSNMGEMEPCTPTRLLKELREHPERDILYADEDLFEEGERREPWFKPDWSPDTFSSIYYLGGVIAIRASYLLRVLPQLPYQEIPKEWVRALVRTGGTQPGHIREILFHAEREAWELEEITHTEVSAAGHMVSVIIPSKDHPELLTRCLRSLRARTAHERYEIIIVDNGSSEESRIALKALEEEYGFIYLYEKEEFNFSRMCNRGARAASGDVLLFLNDDIEILTEEWMGLLAGQALLERAGAVGAKLYYPGGEKRIQHAGISNTLRGPVHKLCGMVDEGSIYHGRNSADYNVCAVTGACLALARKKYEAVGGFAEELAVAYNDVDLCFSLAERGWYNVVRNDAVLLHHESASRGSEADPARRRRQREELRTLYERHPRMRGSDPYYSEHLVQERLTAVYEVGCPCDYERSGCLSELTRRATPRETPHGREWRVLGLDAGLVSHVDEARIMLDGELQIEGWAAPARQAAYQYSRSIFLDGGSGESVFASVYPKYRPDAAAVLPEQPAGELAGWVARIPEGALPDGEYRIGLCYHRYTDVIQATGAVLALREGMASIRYETGSEGGR